MRREALRFLVTVRGGPPFLGLCVIKIGHVSPKQIGNLSSAHDWGLQSVRSDPLRQGVCGPGKDRDDVTYVRVAGVLKPKKDMGPVRASDPVRAWGGALRPGPARGPMGII